MMTLAFIDTRGNVKKFYDKIGLPQATDLATTNFRICKILREEIPSMRCFWLARETKTRLKLEVRKGITSSLFMT